MDAVPEGEVAACGSIDVEQVWGRVLSRVPVGGSQADDHLRPGGDGRLTDVDRRNRVAKGGMRNGCVVAEELLDGGGDPGRVGLQTVELLRVSEQGDDAVPDEAGGRVVAGDDQL